MKKILIADNIAKNRDLLKRTLENHGFPTIEAATSDEVFATDPDNVMLVLTTAYFKDISAFDILSKFKNTPSLADIPFIICSSRNDPEFIAECVQTGFKDIIFRPYNRKIVVKHIKKVLIEEGIMSEDMFLGETQTQKIHEEEKIEFLKYILNMSPMEITPAYTPEVNNAYSYPIVTEFFGISSGEGFNILHELYDEGVLSRTLFDKVGLCPTCNFHTLNFREVCPKCGDLDIEIESIYHHFSCGYVGPAADFKKALNQDEFVCPKCDKVLRHIGLDYEKPSDTFICRKCSFIFTEPAVDFKCFYCDIVAPAEEVLVSEVYSYAPNAKTKKVVEYGSFTAFDIREVLLEKEGSQYSRDFFDYMLKLKYKEHKEYGDPIVLLVFRVQNAMPSLLEDISAYIASTFSSTDITNKNRLDVITELTSRKELKVIKKNAEKILQFINSLKKDNIANENVTCAMMVREFKDEINDIDDFIDSSIDIFLTKEEEIKNTVWVYEK